jgi:hypothetical protein
MQDYPEYLINPFRVRFVERRETIEVDVVNRCLSTLAGRRRKLDGGVMFGRTPRHQWANWIKPDQDNLVDLP